MRPPLSRLVFLSGMLMVAVQPCRGSLRIVEETSLTQGMTNGSMVVFDSDHDGRGELLLRTTYRDIGRIGLGFFEWTPPATFTFVYGDTGNASPQGIEPGNLLPNTAGYLDADSLTDLTGENGEVLQTDTLFLVVCQHEARTFDTYPESLAWYARYDTNAAHSERGYLTDLDRDSRSEILIQKDRVLVFENVLDDSCRLAALLPRPRDRDISMFAIGDLDGDGSTEFGGVGAGRISPFRIWECVGDDAYALVDSLSFHRLNGHDVWYGRDADQNGRAEFFVGFAELDGTWTLYLYQIEATGNNAYDSVFIDSAYCSAYMWSRQSACGDVDGDGVEEVVWSTGTHLHYYKALGPHQYERVATWNNQAGNCADIAIYDINNDGYNEVISSGNNLSFVIAVQAVRLRAPNGGEALAPGDSTSIVWQKFEPPRCDSFSLFLSLDNGSSYDTLATGIPASDTVWPWVVPATPSDSCLVKVVAYGPGWRSDVSDHVFRILPSAMAEAPKGHMRSFGLVVCPNPMTRETYVTFGPHSRSGLSLGIYDPAGRLVRDLTATARSGVGSLCWNRRDDEGHRVTAGVYLVRFSAAGRCLTRKLVVR